MNRFLRSTIALSLLLVSSALAEVSLPRVFTDHMVLQRDAKIPVWGWANSGETVTVTIAGQSHTATTGTDGSWRVALGPIAYSPDAAPLEMTVAGEGNTITLRDILIGEVWVCSGQSNMEWTVRNSRDPDQEIAAANHPKIRLFNVSPKKRPSTQPVNDVEAEWQVCSPETVTNFSAVGYYFGRHLQKELGGIPIGLINVAWGGMPAEAFTPIETLQSNPALFGILEKWNQRMKQFPAILADYEHKLAEWEKLAKAAEAKGEKAPTKPNRPVGPGNPSAPAALWNGMIHPVAPYGIRGAIWYQGETNASSVERAIEYRDLMPAMISAWRERWGQGDFTFLIVQLANYMEPASQPAETNSTWALLREAQAMTLERLPNTGLAVIIDIGEAKDIHPKNKQDVGRRLGLAAEKIAYRRHVVHSGPTYKGMAVEGRMAVIAFDHVGGGLTVKGDKLAGFAIRGENGAWHAAEAQISDDHGHVMVSSPAVERPSAVRYGWANNPPATLYNAEGLPAGPFRTDRD